MQELKSLYFNLLKFSHLKEAGIISKLIKFSNGDSEFDKDLIKKINSEYLRLLNSTKNNTDIIFEFCNFLSDSEKIELGKKMNVDLNGDVNSGKFKRKLKRELLDKLDAFWREGSYEKWREFVIEEIIPKYPLQERLDNFLKVFKEAIKSIMYALELEYFDYDKVLSEAKRTYNYSNSIYTALEDSKFMDYFLSKEVAPQSDIDWRPTETLPEDYYSL